jgi:formylglycine-generating enzyme
MSKTLSKRTSKRPPILEPEAPSIEIVGEESLDDLPVSSRTPMVLSVEEERALHAPWAIQKIERFAGSRWRFVATVATLTMLGLLLRERGDFARWLAHFSKIAPAQAEETLASPAPTGPCPEEMGLVTNAQTGLRVCVDKWEASLVEIQADGEERPWSPYLPVDDGHVVKAVSKPGVVPQGYIDRDSAQGACESAGKRLCHVEEWTTACQGPDKTLYPYGNEADEAACNIHGKSPLGELFSSSFKEFLFDFRVMNDPSLNALEGTLAKTGAFNKCVNGFGLHDMVGNLHEWTAEKNGTFRGGYYQDGHKNGDGCKYATSAHLPTYHDYSTGFRCCKDAE